MAIFVDDVDRLRFLELLATAVREKAIVCHAFCQMTNHYHAVLTTCLANISSVMRQLNGEYAGWWNARHGHVGHVYQGRFGSRLIQDERYLLTASAYVVLNPVRAGIVRSPEDWPWSSHRATAGIEAIPPFLSPGAIWQYGGTRDPRGYREFVAGALTLKLPDEPILGDDEFIARFTSWRQRASHEVPLRERTPRPSLDRIFDRVGAGADRDEGILHAVSHGYPVKTIARYLGVDRTIVRRVVRRNPIPPQPGGSTDGEAQGVSAAVTAGAGQI
jgi:REP element-mobilizing transposase RayT